MPRFARRHYVMIAEAISRMRLCDDCKAIAVAVLSDMFQRDNPAFDARKFRASCEVVPERALNFPERPAGAPVNRRNVGGYTVTDSWCRHCGAPVPYHKAAQGQGRESCEACHPEDWIPGWQDVKTDCTFCK